MGKHDRPKHDAEGVVTAFSRYSVNRRSDFMKYAIAVGWAESGLRNGLISNKGARGMMQVTEPAAIHATGLCPALVGLIPRRVSGNRIQYWYDKSSTNIRLGTCYLQHAYSTAGNWAGALVMYNGGYSALTKLNRGDRLPNETAQYVVSIMNTVATCDKLGE